MARIELTQSGVIFNEELHEYWLGDKQLSGITEALRKQLHPDMYSAIPKRILEQAAQYGTSVHKSIEEFQKNWEITGHKKFKILSKYARTTASFMNLPNTQYRIVRIGLLTSIKCFVSVMIHFHLQI